MMLLRNVRTKWWNPASGRVGLSYAGENASGGRVPPVQLHDFWLRRNLSIGFNHRRRRTHKMSTFELIKGLIDHTSNGGRIGRLRSEFITLISVYSVYSVCSVVPS